jgi:hypothetical protein
MFFIRLLLGINTLFELTVAAILLIKPTFFFNDIEGAIEGFEAISSLGRTFGLASISIAVLSGLMMVTRPLTREVRYVGYGALATFHFGMTIAQIINVIQGLTTILAVAVHGGFALFFLSLFLWTALRE